VQRAAFFFFFPEIPLCSPILREEGSSFQCGMNDTSGDVAPQEQGEVESSPEDPTAVQTNCVSETVAKDVAPAPESLNTRLLDDEWYGLPPENCKLQQVGRSNQVLRNKDAASTHRHRTHVYFSGCVMVPCGSGSKECYFSAGDPVVFFNNPPELSDCNQRYILGIVTAHGSPTQLLVCGGAEQGAVSVEPTLLKCRKVVQVPSLGEDVALQAIDRWLDAHYPLQPVSKVEPGEGSLNFFFLSIFVY
jgi:hypothetical protein